MAIAGRVAIVPKGDWSADVTYKRLDAVTYNNALYFAKKDVPAGTATSNTEYWSKSIVGSAVTVDATMSDTSENPVQNKVVKAYVDKKASENVDFSTSTSKLLNDSIEAPMLVTNATRNLLNPTLEATTKNGVTITKNGDGTYTLNGTNTSSGDPAGTIWIGIASVTLPNQKAVLLGSNNPKVGVYISGKTQTVYGDKSGEIIESDYGKTTTFGIAIAYKATLDNVVVKPMITTDLSATYDDFVPYDGYEIKSCGKNLVTPTYATITLNGITCTNNGDGTYTFNGTATDSIFFNINKNISINKGTKYKVVCFKDEDYIRNKITSCVRRVDTTAEYVFDNGTFVSDAENCWLWIEIVKGVTVSNLVAKPMITTDLNATYDDFVPYQDGGTVQITPSTEFPLLGLKSFDGETNIISPGNVEVTYAKSESGAAIVDTLKKSVSDGKTKVANAITDKGVETATDATFDVLAENISKIDTELHGATLSVVTSDTELFGKTVTLTLKEGSVGTQRKTVFSSNGKCSFVVQKPGTYTVACGADAHEDVTVTSDNVLNKTTMVVALVVLKIVTFASGTDAEIERMIQAHYNNKINITDYWSVGDTRTVNLIESESGNEFHRKQSVEFVIGDFDHDDLTTPINGHTKAAVTLLQKDCLMDEANVSNPTANGSTNTENGSMNSGQTNEGGWRSCSRRRWCNGTYFYALPQTFRELIKTVNKKTSVGNLLSTIETVQDRVFLAAEIEIFGSTTYSCEGEGTQYQYYKNATANRYKRPRWGGNYVSDVYWKRSPYRNNNTSFCVVAADGSANTRSADLTFGISPCVCI